MVVTAEKSVQIFNLKNQGMSIPWISYYVNVNINTIITHLRFKSHEKELKEALPYLSHRSHFRSPIGYTPGKIEPLMDALIRNIHSFGSLLIVGFQNCKLPVTLMQAANKKVIANDVRPSVFNNYPGVIKILEDAVDPKFMNTLHNIKVKYPSCAAYINLTGEEKLIEYIFQKKFDPIIAVVSKRRSIGHKMSSWERSRRLGFKTHKVSKHTWIAIHE